MCHTRELTLLPESAKDENKTRDSASPEHQRTVTVDSPGLHASEEQADRSTKEANVNRAGQQIPFDCKCVWATGPQHHARNPGVPAGGGQQQLKKIKTRKIE